MSNSNSQYEPYSTITVGGGWKIMPGALSGNVSDPNVDLEELRQSAIHSVELATKEPAMTESANALVNIAVETLMQMHGVDRETATHSIRAALGTI